MYTSKSGKTPLLSTGMITFEPIVMVEVKVKAVAGVEVVAQVVVEVKGRAEAVAKVEVTVGVEVEV